MWGNRAAPKHRSDGPRVRSRQGRQSASQGTPLLVHGASRRLVIVSEYHPKVFRDVRVGDTVTVELVPEPSNPFDPHAVAVVISGETAGYLNIGAAERYQAVIQQANRLGYRVQAQGEYEQVASSLTVLLRLPRPDDLKVWLELPTERRTIGYRTPELKA